MKEITTKSGFCVSIDMDVLDNMELLDALAELEENELATSKVAKMVLGADNKKRLYDHLRTDKGNVPVEAFYAELTEIMGELDVKN